MKERPFEAGSRVSTLQLIQELCRAADRNATERAESQEIVITRDDVRCLSIDCQFEELVIFWVTTCFESCRHGDMLCLAKVGGEKT